MTLYMHALDARSPHPILADGYAGPVLERIDYDFGRLKKIAGNLPLILSRAKAIDAIVQSFLSEHPDAVVVHLGCGLDSRVQRVDPGPAVTWFDLDQAPVIDVRRRLIPARQNVTMVAASVSDSQWWSTLPAQRPTLVAGEGLLMYLSPQAIKIVIDNALGRSAIATQTFVFDTVAPWVRQISGLQPNFRSAQTRFESTTADLATAMRHHDDVVLVDEQSVVALARRSTSGTLAGIIGAVDYFKAGHRAMVLQTYRQQRVWTDSEPTADHSS